MPQRDERGRFLTGNTIAEGNRGNKEPKYGNQNAKKHGLFSKTLFTQKIMGDDLILYALHKGVAVRFLKGEWLLIDGGFVIFGEKAERAKEKLGMQFKRVRLNSGELVS